MGDVDRSTRAVFVSHGAPSIVLDDSPAHHFLGGLGASLGRPRAIVVATAHWTTREPAVAAAAMPETIHDFGGFDPALYKLRYAAPGAPDLAADIATRLTAAGFAPRIDPARGFDHGVWTPLMLMYPAADIPVVSLSVQPQRDPGHHVRLGAALRPLLEEDVLFIGSGAATHDLRRFFGQAIDVAESPDVRGFADWLCVKTEAGDVAALSDVWAQGPGARANHPSPEHLLPFHVALGVGGGRGERIHRSSSYGVLAMDAYRFAST